MSDPKDYVPQSAVDVSNEPVHWDLGDSKSYGEYLKLDQILSAQKPNTFEHNEMMFIIIHQASELWMKLSIHELDAAIKEIQRDNLGPVLKNLARVSRIQTQLTQSWDILATMTPMDYSAFRNSLGKASGF
jgi:Tryptophan 2,3-dioxygenase (vermilion)